MVAEGDKVAVHWRARGTFTGTGRFEGFVANGKPVDMRGADMLTVEDGKIVANFAYTNGWSCPADRRDAAVGLRPGGGDGLAVQREDRADQAPQALTARRFHTGSRA